MASKLHETDVNPLQQAFDDYHIMQDELRTSEKHVKELTMMNGDLMRENDFNRAEITKLRGERDRLQAYSIDLTARLDVISETISNAVNESRKFAVKPVVPVVVAVDDMDEQASAADIVARLPPRLPLQNKFG